MLQLGATGIKMGGWMDIDRQTKRRTVGWTDRYSPMAASFLPDYIIHFRPTITVYRVYEAETARLNYCKVMVMYRYHIKY